MKNSLAFLAAPLLLSACAVGDLGFGVSRQAIFSADTPDELVALGGVRLIDEAITVSLSGGSFVEPNENWIWEINADGTHHARDADGDWADPPGGLWHVVDGMFCRENEDLALKCSEVYKIGPLLPADRARRAAGAVDDHTGFGLSACGTCAGA